MEEAARFEAKDIELKSYNNFVTYVDKQSEEKLIRGLSSILPGTSFIAEENPSLKTGSINWVIDPLDGTTNFIHHLPVFCISIALMEKNRVIIGVIYEINQKELFYTWEGAPAFLNGNIIHVSGSSHLIDCLFATGFPYYDFGRLDEYLLFFKYLMQTSRGVRRIGSAAADLAYVACGRFDGFYEYGLSPWDVAAGTLIVQNAGGKICDFHNGDDFIFGKEIVATNENVFTEFLNALKGHFH